MHRESACITTMFQRSSDLKFCHGRPMLGQHCCPFWGGVAEWDAAGAVCEAKDRVAAITVAMQYSDDCL